MMLHMSRVLDFIATGFFQAIGMKSSPVRDSGKAINSKSILSHKEGTLHSALRRLNMIFCRKTLLKLKLYADFLHPQELIIGYNCTTTRNMISIYRITAVQVSGQAGQAQITVT